MRDHALDRVKWLALIAMVIDHVWYLLPADLQSLLYGMRAIGRLAFPLFCLAIAANVVREEKAEGFDRYLGALIFFGVLTHQVHSSFFEEPNLNVMFTLALGLVVARAVQHRTRSSIAAGVGALVIALIFAITGKAMGAGLLYGIPGVLLPATLVMALRAKDFEGLIVSAGLAAAFSLAGNTTVWNFVYLDQLQAGTLALMAMAAAAPVIGLLVLRSPAPSSTRPVGQWMYLFYPIHLAGFAVVKGVFA
jgi:hypothetical protein